MNLDYDTILNLISETPVSGIRRTGDRIVCQSFQQGLHVSDLLEAIGIETYPKQLPMQQATEIIPGRRPEPKPVETDKPEKKPVRSKKKTKAPKQPKPDTEPVVLNPVMAAVLSMDGYDDSDAVFGSDEIPDKIPDEIPANPEPQDDTVSALPSTPVNLVDYEEDWAPPF